MSLPTNFADILNNNKYLACITMLLVNIGSKYVTIDISKGQEKILKNVIVRRFILFSIFFAGTRDLFLSVGFTILFVFLNTGLFHEDSKFCMLSKNLKYTDITETEYNEALNTIDKYKLQSDNNPHEEADKQMKSNYLKLKEKVNVL